MHIDENKKFDKRNIERNIKDGLITKKDYDIYLSKLPDLIDNIYNQEESSADSIDFESNQGVEIQPKKKGLKKKSK